MGGVTATSLTTWGISSMAWKGKSKELTTTPITSTSSIQPNTQPQHNPTCEVFKVEGKESQNPKITKINWEEEKVKDTKSNTDNKDFWSSVDTACKGTDKTNKPSYNGRVYVTETGGKWNYSKEDQKEWTSVTKQ
ncbi:hypothetical protein MHC_02295 [Mycoplasma haemocanis str. Illinois]|uniref:Uncharacterized protein n=1 Tax=Mycoplasma haemocanis (strain Illinois) TaxID=1111676 RepID=H6N6Q3_MYCHN|nr:hypothetical protein MHC_02295 [Mycoplasma haemocanis str. Illinois]